MILDVWKNKMKIENSDGNVSVSLKATQYNVEYNVEDVGLIKGQIKVAHPMINSPEISFYGNRISIEGIYNDWADQAPMESIIIEYNLTPELSNLEGRVEGEVKFPTVPCKESGYYGDDRACKFITDSPEYGKCVVAVYKILEEIASREELKWLKK